MRLFDRNKKNKGEPWGSTGRTGIRATVDTFLTGSQTHEVGAKIRESDRWLTTEDEAWIESVLTTSDFQARLDKIGFRLQREGSDWVLRNTNKSQVYSVSEYKGDGSTTGAENFVRDVMRAVEANEAFEGFENLYRRAIAVGWEPMLEDLDLYSCDTVVEVERPLDYDSDYDSESYEERDVYPLNLAGLQQFKLNLNAEEVWRSLHRYFDDIDQLGWQIVKLSGKFALYTSDAYYERILHPAQVKWLENMIATEGTSGDPNPLLGT